MNNANDFDFASHVTTDRVRIDGVFWIRVWADGVRGGPIRHHTSQKGEDGLHKGYGPARKICRMVGRSTCACSWQLSKVWVVWTPELNKACETPSERF